MADEAPSVLDRIDRALARIEAAATAQTRSTEALVRRHDTLRAHIAEAIGSLDTMIAGGPPETEQTDR